MLQSSISRETYDPSEADTSLRVCVVLDGLIEREIIIALFVEEDSATGMTKKTIALEIVSIYANFIFSY